MSKPLDIKLYNSVKKKANKVFTSKSGVYRSSWIVREYKKLGGKYSKSNKKSGGLKRWYKEKWVDLNRPIRNSRGKIIGYKNCGRKSTKNKGSYPLCRPSKRISKKTPKTYKELGTLSIKKAKKDKQKVKGTRSIKFKRKSKPKRKSTVKRKRKSKPKRKSYKKVSAKKATKA